MNESNQPSSPEHPPPPQQDQQPSSEPLPFEPFETEWFEKGAPPSEPLRPPAEKRSE
jgi:hypothetical protein